MADTEKMPLLRGEGRERLDGCPRAAYPLVKHLVNIVAIRSLARPNSCRNQVGFFSEVEELGVLAAVERQQSILNQATVLPAINRGAGIAIATIHMRRCARNIHCQLRY